MGAVVSTTSRRRAFKGEKFLEYNAPSVIEGAFSNLRTNCSQSEQFSVCMNLENAWYLSLRFSLAFMSNCGAFLVNLCYM